METNYPVAKNKLQAYLRSFRVAAWLGWQIESNWTDPFLFAVYSIIKPLAGAAILVVMFGVITHGNFTSPIFSYIYLGNAFYVYVGSIMTGISWAVIDDREHYKTLKYMYVAPINIRMYLIGRGVARFLVASITVIITITVGYLFLHVNLDLAAVNWPLFLLALVMGLVTVWHTQVYTLVGRATRHEGFFGRLATAGWAVWFYIYKAVLPVGLNVLYPRWSVNAANPLAYLPGLALVACLIRRTPPLSALMLAVTI